MQEVETRADSNIGSSDSEDESYGVWFPEPVDCQFTPRRTEISQKDAVVSEDVTGNVEHSDTRVEFTYDTFGVPKVEPVLAQAKVVNPVRYCSTAYLWLNMPSRKLSNCAVTLNPRQ